MVGAAGRREDKAIVALSREDGCQPDVRRTEVEWIWWSAINHDVITTYTDHHIRRQIIVVQYLLDELMLTRNG
jgi:hypothetical protein